MIDKIRIGGIDFDVNLVHDLRDNDGKKLDGRIIYGDCAIMIDDKLSYQAQYQTLLHEIIHGILTTMGRDVDENTVDGMAYGWMQVIRDNPNLFMEISYNNHDYYNRGYTDHSRKLT